MFEALGTGATIAAENGSAHPPLGRLLVDRGFIGEDQLEYALSEHERTGLPLGQVLISLSYVTASTIAQALATQHGGLLKTEYGFGTGFDATMDAVEAAPAAGPGPAMAEAAVVPLLPPVEVAPPVEMAEPEPEPEPAPLVDALPRPEPQPEAIPAPMPEPVPVVAPAAAAFVPPEPLPSLELPEAQARIAELVELAVASARRETGALRQDAEIARHEAEMALQDVEAIRRDLAASREDAEAARAGVDAVRRELEAARAEIEAARGEAEAARQEAAVARQAVADNQACALRLEQLQAELAMTTENLRNAYSRLHQFEIAQALQQHPAPQVQPAAPVQPAPPVQMVAPPPAHAAPAPASPSSRQS